MNINKYRFLHTKKYVSVNLKNFASEGQCLDVTGFALNSGADIVELISEGLNFSIQENFVRKFRELTSAFDALFLISSRTDAAMAFCADGVVVSEGDLNPCMIRKLAGENFIIGQKISSKKELSCDTDIAISSTIISDTEIPVFCKTELADFFSDSLGKIAVELTPELLQH